MLGYATAANFLGSIGIIILKVSHYTCPQLSRHSTPRHRYGARCALAIAPALSFLAIKVVSFLAQERYVEFQ